MEDTYENIENYATVPINLSSSIFKDPVSKQCITLANDLQKIKEVRLLKIYHLCDKNIVRNILLCVFLLYFTGF